jgi:predicted small metal-binding protein
MSCIFQREGESEREITKDYFEHQRTRDGIFRE